MSKSDYRTYRKKVKTAYAGAWIMLGIAFMIGAIIGSVLTGLFSPVAAQTTPTINLPYLDRKNVHCSNVLWTHTADLVTSRIIGI